MQFWVFQIKFNGTSKLLYYFRFEVNFYKVYKIAMNVTYIHNKLVHSRS